MIKSILVIFSLFAAAYGSGHLAILGAPDSLSFKKTDKIDGEYIGDAFRAFMGYSTTKSVPMKVQINNPFDLCENAVLLNVFGIPNMEPQNLKPISDIQLTGSSYSIESLDYVIQENNRQFIHLNMEDLEEALPILESMCDTQVKPSKAKITSSFKSDNVENKPFYGQIAALAAFAEVMANDGVTCNIPDVFLIDFDFRTLDPKARDELVPVFTIVAEQFAQAVSKNTKGKAIVGILTTQTQSIKRTRRAADNATETEPKAPVDINLAPTYTDNYPVIFNIILWFGVVITFSLLAVSYAIATMDPGRDSIIYRMTSTRIKKDN